MVRGSAHAVARAEIERLFALDPPPPVDAVWTPETRGPVAPEDSALALAAYERGQRAALRAALTSGASNGVLLAVLAIWVAPKDSLALLLGLAAFAVAIVALPALVRLVRVRRDPRGALRRALEDGARASRLAAASGTKRAVGASWALAGVIGAVFVAQAQVGMEESAYAAGLTKQVLRDGAWWRLLTCTLVHGFFVHLLFNLLALVRLGTDVEFFSGRERLPTIFLVSALGGSLASLYLGPPGKISVGASGGICGLLGWLAVLGWKRREAIPRRFGQAVGTNLVLLAAIGVVGSGMIDNAAHGGGLVAGALLAFLTVRRGRTLPLEPRRTATVAGLLSSLVLLAGALLAAVAILYPDRFPLRPR